MDAEGLGLTLRGLGQYYLSEGVGMLADDLRALGVRLGPLQLPIRAVEYAKLACGYVSAVDATNASLLTVFRTFSGDMVRKPCVKLAWMVLRKNEKNVVTGHVAISSAKLSSLTVSSRSANLAIEAPNV